MSLVCAPKRTFEFFLWKATPDMKLPFILWLFNKVVG
jgi:hypothetical protein